MAVGCGIKLPDHIDLPTQITGGDPKTLEAATTAAQEVMDRLSSGDFPGVWLMMSTEVRDKISQADYATLQEACTKTGIPIKVEGVRMDGADRAIVRVHLDFPVLSGFKSTDAMLYEDGKWVEAPDPDYAPDYGLPVQQIIAKRTAAGHCNKSTTSPTPTSSAVLPPGDPTDFMPHEITPVPQAAPLPAGGAFVVPGTAYAFPAEYNPHIPATERPQQVFFDHRFHMLSNLAWTWWGPSGAHGTGSEWVQTDCTPSCAVGASYTNPVEIFLSNPISADPDSSCPSGVLFYSDVLIAYPNTVPPTGPSLWTENDSDLQWTTYNGMTAAHYPARKATCVG